MSIGRSWLAILALNPARAWDTLECMPIRIEQSIDGFVSFR